MGKSIEQLTADALDLIARARLSPRNAADEVTVSYSPKVQRAVRRRVLELIPKEGNP